MKSVKYYIAKVMSRLTKSQAPIERFYRQRGVKLGENCLVCSYIMTKEPFLLEIGDNCTVSTNVSFVTHDNCAKLLFSDRGDLFGKIKIGDNCFIGENATILYGVELSANTIVAAGSVVTKSFMEPYTVIGGNPARVISTWDILRDKSASKAIKRKEMLKRIGKDDSFLVIR